MYAIVKLPPRGHDQLNTQRRCPRWTRRRFEVYIWKRVNIVGYSSGPYDTHNIAHATIKRTRGLLEWDGREANGTLNEGCVVFGGALGGIGSDVWRWRCCSSGSNADENEIFGYNFLCKQKLGKFCEIANRRARRTSVSIYTYIHIYIFMLSLNKKVLWTCGLLGCRIYTFWLNVYEMLNVL